VVIEVEPQHRGEISLDAADRAALPIDPEDPLGAGRDREGAQVAHEEGAVVQRQRRRHHVFLAAERSVIRKIFPVSGWIRTISPWLGSTAKTWSVPATSEYQVPSGSKSPGDGCATGWLAWKALRSATMC
jgi:hypothetical protein